MTTFTAVATPRPPRHTFALLIALLLAFGIMSGVSF